MPRSRARLKARRGDFVSYRSSWDIMSRWMVSISAVLDVANEPTPSTLKVRKGFSGIIIPPDPMPS
eukprot:14514407-Heterocapsa_arctica.AAC.1